MEQNKITDIDEIRQKHGAQEIALPGWEPGETFFCRAKRPSLLNLAASGTIPNPLLGAASALFSGAADTINKVSVADQARVAQCIARYALVEPTYQQLQDAGVDLTDEQLLCLYSFAVGGARALEPFRARLRAGAGHDDAAVPPASVAADNH